MTSPTQAIPAAPFTPILPKGYILGEYKIESVRGQGSFGITYSATELMTNYPVVIKENYPSTIAYRDPISGELRPMPKCEERYRWALKSFEKEARTLRKLPKHTNLVHVTSVFRALNTAYIVMEPIDGKNLAELYPQGSQVEPQLLESILRKLLCALEPLHKQGIIHRDIKPGNIMLTTAGEPVLIDFGAARPTQGTHTATQIGTRGYAPPEQLELAEHGENTEHDENTEHQSPQPHWDLYALGCTCHQLITGYVPVSGARTLSERPELQGRYNSALLATIDKAHAKSPADRWQSAQEWMAAIDSSYNTTATPVNGTRVPTIEEPALTPKITQQAAQAELQRRGISAGEYDRKLHDAAKDGDAELVKLLIDAGTDVNKANANEWTPLCTAAANGRTDCVKLLINAGADVNKADEDSETPLFTAAANGHAECMKLLIAAGADVNKVDKEGWTPLCMAAWKGRTECVKLLINAGADVNKADKAGWTPLYWAAYNGQTECVKLLINAGADVNKADKLSGYTPLYMAEEEGHTECAELLRAAGNTHVPTIEEPAPTPKITQQTAQAELQRRGISAGEYDRKLLYAAENGNAELMKLLIAAGADVNKSYGWTPLYRAADYGHAECVKLLITAGADVNKADRYVYGATPLYCAADKGRTECMKLLIAAGADVNKANEKGYTPLLNAAIKGRTEYLRLLLAAGADVNWADKEGKTPLYWAAYYGQTECMKQLLAAGADVNKASHYGSTPLYYAAYYGHTECVKLLIDAGADVNKADKFGETPLYKAEGRGHTECAELLRAAGGNTGGMGGFFKRLFS